MEHAEELLEDKGLRKTPVRKEVLGAFFNKSAALSLKQIEENFEKIDRITLYRTLRAFEEKGVIHKVFDGTDKVKYALCKEHCTDEQHEHQHIHFHCNSCDETFCVEGPDLPGIKAPANFQMESLEVVMSGKCGDCSVSS